MPIRPAVHHASQTTVAARNAFTAGSTWSAATGPISATSGISTIAGNGANGTYTRPSIMIASLTRPGSNGSSTQVRPWRNASAR